MDGGTGVLGTDVQGRGEKKRQSGDMVRGYGFFDAAYAGPARPPKQLLRPHAAAN